MEIDANPCVTGLFRHYYSKRVGNPYLSMACEFA
jgi:hypothetical protein